jgi:hypothetical protein
MPSKKMPSVVSKMQALWGTDYPKFKKEDPTRTSSFKGLDRTKIPANSNYLINDPIGLGIFLRLAKNRTPSHPMSAVGLSPGPAFMSYGSAVAKYGPPEDPGEDWPSEDQIDDGLQTASDVSSTSNVETTPSVPPSSWALFRKHFPELYSTACRTVRQARQREDSLMRIVLREPSLFSLSRGEHQYLLGKHQRFSSTLSSRARRVASYASYNHCRLLCFSSKG